MSTEPKNVPQAEVLAWLAAHHPELHQTAHIEREWVWLTANLQGDANRDIRTSIKEFGFRFARNGHELPNGVTAHWAHHGAKPIPFRRKKRNAPGAWSRAPGMSEQEQRQAALAEALAALKAVG